MDSKMPSRCSSPAPSSLPFPSREACLANLKPVVPPPNGDCPVCLAPSPWTAPVALHGTHTFCTTCITRWLQDHPTCPLCRTQVYLEAPPRTPALSLPFRPAPPGRQLTAPAPGPDMGIYLFALHAHVATMDRLARWQNANRDTNWWFLSPPRVQPSAPQRVLLSVQDQAAAWMAGEVQPMEEGLRRRSGSPMFAAVERLPALTMEEREIDGRDLGVALEVAFMRRLEMGLRVREIAALHPLFWYAFSKLLVRVGELGGRVMSAEGLEDELERAVWDGVEGRIPLLVPGWPTSGWAAVAQLEERGMVPEGVRQLVVDLIEEVMRVHEELPRVEMILERMVPRRDGMLI